MTFLIFLFFFFQAEDGIRDRDVTGVQTWLFRSVTEPFYVGRVELRPVGSWGLTDAYRDIDRFIPGAGRLLDEDAKYRVAGSFTYTTLRTETEAPLTDRIVEAHSAARRQALAQLETATAALRLATASTSQVVVDIDAPPGRVRLLKPQVYRHDVESLEITQRIGRIRPDDAGPLASLGDRLVSWAVDRVAPHSSG